MADKTKECEAYMKMLEEKRELYNVLMQKKQGSEENKNNIIDDLEKQLLLKEREI